MKIFGKDLSMEVHCELMLLLLVVIAVLVCLAYCRNRSARGDGQSVNDHLNHKYCMTCFLGQPNNEPRQSVPTSMTRSDENNGSRLTVGHHQNFEPRTNNRRYNDGIRVSTNSDQGFATPNTYDVYAARTNGSYDSAHTFV